MRITSTAVTFLLAIHTSNSFLFPTTSAPFLTKINNQPQQKKHSFLAPPRTILYSEENSSFDELSPVSGFENFETSATPAPVTTTPEEDADAKEKELAQKAEATARSLLETRLAIEAMEKKIAAAADDDDDFVVAGAETEAEEVVEEEEEVEVVVEEEEPEPSVVAAQKEEEKEGEKTLEAGQKEETLHRSLLAEHLAIDAKEREVAKKQQEAIPFSSFEDINGGDVDAAATEVLEEEEEAEEEVIVAEESEAVSGEEEEEIVAEEETPVIVEEDIEVVEEPSTTTVPEDKEEIAADAEDSETPEASTAPVTATTEETASPKEEKQEQLKKDSSSPATIPTNMSLVPINESTIEFTSGLVAGIAGLAIGGPTAAIAASLIANYLSRDKENENSASALVQNLSRSAIEFYNTLASVQSEYKVFEKTGEISRSALEKVKGLDGVDKETVEKVEETVTGTAKKIGEWNEEFGLVDSASQAL
eukprot:CAMPEP_0185737404 /NCGR_PEP_ID=MMETSP1171-20130828/30301_1 /TAXON_ID=374046 /ORGANISM="Helicotheca tamensis, Strain CCMP826" /LENGTH=477 /DNA_ID=CAMNT_0028408317 /DNA_START=76 /DNA_END=1506 /DNA_ORIENTATION=+